MWQGKVLEVESLDSKVHLKFYNCYKSYKFYHCYKISKEVTTCNTFIQQIFEGLPYPRYFTKHLWYIHKQINDLCPVRLCVCVCVCVCVWTRTHEWRKKKKVA
jgi:hypothetical protein